jgi:RNA polymerase sigma-70 factor (ECF subfamily)
MSWSQPAGAASRLSGMSTDLDTLDTADQAPVASDPGPSFHDALVALLPKLRVQALSLTRNKADADDLVQAAVTNALAAQSSFTPGTNFGAWMYRILRNRFISDRRRLRETVDMDDAPSDAFARPASQEDSLALRELRIEMAKLPADQRTALVMVTVQGMSYEEVAAAMGCAVGTAKCRVFRARCTLEARLMGDGETGGTAKRRRGAGVAASAPRSVQKNVRHAATASPVVRHGM